MMKINLKKMKKNYEEIKETKEYEYLKINAEYLKDTLAVCGTEIVAAMLCAKLNVSEKAAMRLLNVIAYGGSGLATGKWIKKHIEFEKKNRLKVIDTNRIVNFHGLDVIFDRDGNVINKKELKELLDKIELDDKVIDFNKKANK